MTWLQILSATIAAVPATVPWPWAIDLFTFSSAANAGSSAKANEKRDACQRQTGMLTLSGGPGDDRFFGGETPAKLSGDEDRDFILGSSEDDEIIGGQDGDLMIGGAGGDLFVYSAKSDSQPDSNGRWSSEGGDTIVDFDTDDRDRIDLRELAKFGQSAPATFQWSGTTAKAYAVWTASRHGDTFLAVDLDGNAFPDLAIRLIGNVRLTHTSFCGVGSAKL